LRWARLTINFQKSSAIFLRSTNLTSLIIKGILRCPRSTFPFTYLGLPIRLETLSRRDWVPLIEKMGKKKLEGWKGKALSLRVIITLLNASLSASPLYSLFLFELPKWVELCTDKIRLRFLWRMNSSHRGRYNLVRWEKVCCLKEEDGLGVINLRNMNKSLLSKWWWKFVSKPKSLAASICLCKYGNRGSVWSCEPNTIRW